MSLDPVLVEAQSLLASILAERALGRMTDTSADDFARAEALVRQVLAASPRSPIAHYAYGQVLRATRRNEQAIPEYQEALAFNRGWADALAGLGRCKFWVGSIDEAIALHEQAIRLSPRDPQIGYWYFRIGSCISCNRALKRRSLGSKKVVVRFRLSRWLIPFWLPPMRSTAILERGATELAETFRLSGKVWVSTIANMKVTGYWGPPKIRALNESVYFAGLRKPGVPEE